MTKLMKWSISVIIWLGSAYYFSSQKNFTLSELIIWSPLIMFVLFEQMRTPKVLTTPRDDANRDFDRMVSNIQLKDNL